MTAFLLSTAVIFVAELGDKSQLMAMTFAARYRVAPVLVGITLATALVHLASVAAGATVGAVLGRHLPERAVRYGAAASFVVFGLVLVAEGLGLV